MSEKKGAWSSVPVDMTNYYGCPPLPLKTGNEETQSWFRKNLWIIALGGTLLSLLVLNYVFLEIFLRFLFSS